MTIDEIVQQSFTEPRCDRIAAEAFCIQENIAIENYFEMFTEHVVKGYLDGRFSWTDCDTAMMGLSTCMTNSSFNPDCFAWDVYVAFDCGEFHPKTPELTSDEVTRPLIHQILLEYDISL
jgi:hypothetical protein